MSEALDKAKAALLNARDVEESDGRTTAYLDLIAVAQAQALIAQAEALEFLADVFEQLAGELLGA